MAHGGARPGAGRKPMSPEAKAERRKRIQIARPTVAIAPQPASFMSSPAAMTAIAQIVEASEAHARQHRRTIEFSPFQLPKFPPKAIPPPDLRMAMDEATSWAATEWAGGALANVAAEGLLFLGYPYLSELAQRPEYRVMSETIATEMTRKWIKFKGTGDEDKTERIKELTDFLDHLETRDRFADLAMQDGLFGRTHLFMDVGQGLDEGDEDELKTPIGDGRGAVSKSKVSRQSPLKRLQVIEPVWTYPTTYNATNPLSPDWYNPQVWYVMGRQIHRTRIPTFIGRPVPDLLKPAYSFGGLSLTQLAKPYVDIWLTTRQSVGSLIHSFSVMVLMTDLQTILQPGSAAGLLTRVAMFNALRDNQGAFVVNKTTEDFKNVSAPISGLHELQAQSQEHMMCCQAGTLVETDRGQVEIEKVTPEYRVMTRYGLAPIKWAGQTGTATKLIEIQTGDSVLRTTEWHPIWSETIREFANAENVDTSHRLLRSTKWENTAPQFRGVGAGGGRPKPGITAIPKLAASFIVKSMRFMSGLFPRALMFITSMMTRLITALPTSNFSLAPITTHGTSPQMVASTSTASDQRPNSARSAATPSRLSCQSELFIAPLPAKACSGDPVDVMYVRTIEGPSEPVYNIEVADGFLPEFYANGILVHNSVARIPAVKFTGIQPTGLNASSEGEMRAFNDTIHAHQNFFFRPNLTVVIRFAMLSLWGEVDEEITYEFESLVELTDKEKAEKRKADAETGEIHINSGVISPEEERQRIISDPESAYQGLDPEDIPDLAEEEEQGLMPGGKKPGGGDAPGGAKGGEAEDDDEATTT